MVNGVVQIGHRAETYLLIPPVLISLLHATMPWTVGVVLMTKTVLILLVVRRKEMLNLSPSL
jgi:hypothetical protein